MKYIDPDGKWVHIAVGAGIGALVSTGISIASQLTNNGEIDLATTALAFGAGALSGGLAASGVGLVGQIAANGVIGGAHNLATQRIENGNFDETDLNQLGLSIATGMLSGLLGGKGAESGHMRSLTNQLAKRITNAFQHKTGDALRKELVNACSYFIKSNGMKDVAPETIKAILRSNIPAGYNLGKDGYEKMINEIAEETK